jgi:ribosomal protein S18 acetylase RimI-like enzyme
MNFDPDAASSEASSAISPHYWALAGLASTAFAPRHNRFFGMIARPMQYLIIRAYAFMFAVAYVDDNAIALIRPRMRSPVTGPDSSWAWLSTVAARPQRRGYGSTLLTLLCHQADITGTGIELATRSDSARRLYTKFGFEVSGCRRSHRAIRMVRTPVTSECPPLFGNRVAERSAIVGINRAFGSRQERDVRSSGASS